jgi:hypothetical protein
MLYTCWEKRKRKIDGGSSRSQFDEIIRVGKNLQVISVRLISRERSSDMTQGHMDRGVRSSVPLPAFLCVDFLFSIVQNRVCSV